MNNGHRDDNGDGVDTVRTDPVRKFVGHLGFVVDALRSSLGELAGQLLGASPARRRVILVGCIEEVARVRRKLGAVEELLIEQAEATEPEMLSKPAADVVPKLPPPNGRKLRSLLLWILPVVLALGACAALLNCYHGEPTPRPIDKRNPYDPTQPAGIPRVTKCLGGPQDPDCLWPFGKRRDGGIDR